MKQVVLCITAFIYKDKWTLCFEDTTCLGVMLSKPKEQRTHHYKDHLTCHETLGKDYSDPSFPLHKTRTRTSLPSESSPQGQTNGSPSGPSHAPHCLPKAFCTSSLHAASSPDPDLHPQPHRSLEFRASAQRSWCTDSLVHRASGVQSPGVQRSWCTGVLMHRGPHAQGCWCTEVLELRCPEACTHRSPDLAGTLLSSCVMSLQAPSTWLST